MGMYYIRWSDKEIKGLEITQIWAEIETGGRVCREVGLDIKRSIVHKCPSNDHPLGEYGYFDLASIDTSNLSSNISQAEFQKLWDS